MPLVQSSPASPWMNEATCGVVHRGSAAQKIILMQRVGTVQQPRMHGISVGFLYMYMVYLHKPMLVNSHWLLGYVKLHMDDAIKCMGYISSLSTQEQ